MMNLRLNLLSPFKKTKLKNLTRFIFIKEILEIVVLISSLLAIALLLSWWVMVEEFNNISQSTLLINRDYLKYNQEIKKINKTINELNLAGQGYYPLIPRLLELINQLPADIRLTALNIDRRQQTLYLSGVAKNRTALLNFEETLEKLSWVEKVVTPPSTLFQKDNISFEMRTGLKDFPPLPPSASRRK